MGLSDALVEDASDPRFVLVEFCVLVRTGSASLIIVRSRSCRDEAILRALALPVRCESCWYAGGCLLFVRLNVGVFADVKRRQQYSSFTPAQERLANAIFLRI